jgi:lantibiotic leader peptide-processing serine protease
MARCLHLRRLLPVALTALAVSAMSSPATAGVAFEAGAVKTYVVVFDATQQADGTYDMVADTTTALSLVRSAGGAVSSDLSSQIGVMIVNSPNALFAQALRASPLVEVVGEDFRWKGVPTKQEALATAAPLSHPGNGGGGPEQTVDPLESQQWSMMQIHAPQAHAVQAGWRAVDVGILDTGIDGNHLDFDDDAVAGGSRNVDCVRGRDSLAVLPPGVAIGTPDPCSDNGFHGTHVAGIVAAQANNHGVVGVAPNVTLVPVKVCDSTGYCYASPVIDGITYAGDQKFDVINMSFFVDDNEFQQSTEYKCMDDPVQRAFRRGVERAIQYARSQGVAPVAALGNSDDDLAHPPEPYDNNCDVVPAETQGVVGTASLGSQRQKASYSNWGIGATDVTAPGGAGTTGDCTNTVLSTFPDQVWFCIQGTSMASPHAAGVAALIVSQFGTLGSDGDVKLSPTKVESHLQGTTIDQGLPGYDECFGNGRIDSLRAVQHDTSRAYDATAPFCPEYEQ